MLLDIIITDCIAIAICCMLLHAYTHKLISHI